MQNLVSVGVNDAMRTSFALHTLNGTRTNHAAQQNSIHIRFKMLRSSGSLASKMATLLRRKQNGVILKIGTCLKWIPFRKYFRLDAAHIPWKKILLWQTNIHAKIQLEGEDLKRGNYFFFFVSIFHFLSSSESSITVCIWTHIYGNLVHTIFLFHFSY